MHSLMTLYVFIATALPSCNRSQPSKPKTFKKNKNTYVYTRPELTIRVDTINVTDKNYNYMKNHSAAGAFHAGTNMISLYHFRAQSNKSYIIKYCEHNNRLRQLALRHEKEHARKQDLVHGPIDYSPMGNARRAAMNEIVAPAAEIIEFVDYHTRTGDYLLKKLFFMRADSAINKIPYAMTQNGVDFNYCPVADVVIIYAMQEFLGAVNRGYYRHTIRRAYRRKPYKRPANVGGGVPVPFNPDLDEWEPIWELESDAGPCNPYRHASWHVRRELMRSVDSVIYSTTDAGKFIIFHKPVFLR